MRFAQAIIIYLEMCCALLESGKAYFSKGRNNYLESVKQALTIIKGIFFRQEYGYGVLYIMDSHVF